MKSLLLHNKTNGFTLIEMMVVAPMVILIIGTIIVSIVTLTGESLIEGGRAQLLSDVQDSLERIEEDVETSGAFLAANNFTPTAPQGLNDSNQKFVSEAPTGPDSIVLNTFATTARPSEPTRSLVYLPNTPFACNDANIAQNQVLTLNIVYFVKDSALWRRTVATDTYASKPCAGVTVWQQPNCAPASMSVNPGFCVAEDEKLLEGVAPTDFTVDYFRNASDTTPAAGTEDSNVVNRQAALDSTPTIQVSLRGNKTIAGRNINQFGTIRVTRDGSLVKYATPQP